MFAISNSFVDFLSSDTGGIATMLTTSKLFNRLSTRCSPAQVKAITKVKSYRKMNPNHRKFAERSTADSRRRSLLQDAPPPPPVFPLDEKLYNGTQEPPQSRAVSTCQPMFSVLKCAQAHC